MTIYLLLFFFFFSLQYNIKYLLALVGVSNDAYANDKMEKNKKPEKKNKS